MPARLPLPPTVQEIVDAYKFPFELRGDQVEDIDFLVRYDRVGLFLDMGLGKTAVATAICFYHGLQGSVHQVLCLVPPVLVKQWELWLREFPDLSITVYRGTPAQRKKIGLEADFIITTLGLFKNDHERFMGSMARRRLAVVVDEAAAIRMPNTGNYKAVRDLVETPSKKLLMLTGTPLGAHPATGYGLIKLKTPDVYRDYRQFLMLHVTGVDMRGNPTGFRNLDLLQTALMSQSVFRRAEDVLELPEVQHIPVKYELGKQHQALYNELIDELLLTLDNGTVIDATTTQKLYSRAQQFIMEVPDGGKIRPAGFDVLDQVIEETGLLRLDNEKLIVFVNFRKTNEAIIAYLQAAGIGCVQVYGGADNQKALDKFRDDTSIKIMVAQPKSSGIGLNLQFCRYQLFLETPITSGDFQQAVARIKRSGQTRKCQVWIAVALNTLQETIVRNTLRKESVLQKVTPTKATLRAALTGKAEIY